MFHKQKATPLPPLRLVQDPGRALEYLSKIKLSTNTLYCHLAVNTLLILVHFKRNTCSRSFAIDFSSFMTTFGNPLEGLLWFSARARAAGTSRNALLGNILKPNQNTKI